MNCSTMSKRKALKTIDPNSVKKMGDLGQVNEEEQQPHKKKLKQVKMVKWLLLVIKHLLRD